MKRLILIGVILSLMTACGKDELPEPQKEDLPKKCAGCSNVDRPKVSDTITKK